MRLSKKMIALLAVLFLSQSVYTQSNRIKYNNQDLFLSGSNLAWISFANDIGADKMDYKTFGDILLQMHDNGGNSLRWWIHTNGSASPVFDNLGNVTGPGSTTIAELKKSLDIAWEREIGVVICLWSFDMLRSSNSAAMLDRNTKLLTDTNYTRTYINNALIPIVDSLKDHPAIIAWEIFNEPEGMTNLLPWGDVKKVPIQAIQRFVNLCAGAIHRTDPDAIVTNGSVSVSYITDVVAPPLGKVSDLLAQYSAEEKILMEEMFYNKYGFRQTAEQLISTSAAANKNYYSDAELIASGGDSLGTLDIYTFHYYSWQGNGLSPFTNPITKWNFDRPVVVGEFHLTNISGQPLKQYLYSSVYANGYAGAWAWSWTDNQTTQKTDILASLKFMWDNHKVDVDVNGIGGDFPTVSIISPSNNSKFPANSEVTITAEAADADGTVTSVEFFANDTLKIGTATASPYSVVWTNIPNEEYRLTAIATDNLGHQRTSSTVLVTVGNPPFTKLEAESALKQGANIAVKSDASASKGYFVDMAAQTGTITWTFNNYLDAGNYEIVFGYRLAYNTPKGQFINVNGTRVTEIMFDGAMNVWQEKKLEVDLVKGQNTIQMELSWGYMHIDYLAVPTELVTDIEEEINLPLEFSLKQNYPNPFNPNTTIKFNLPKKEYATLKIYNIAGEEVETILSGELNAGEHKINWNASKYASGVYVYKISAGNFSASRKMILLK